ncbi:HDL365Cp [Eremothecium sinecaudum]|uniref:HDL365Cp n=1 Tax=Eremothecium sinecaudum TaxID=45286 RepID=A0A0X8HS12_9SACH|nr:HDL365Cp [Eremothecium sinecaudum]AMD20379.1 HDL365Cp [Eremothecium sinecaudum]
MQYKKLWYNSSPDVKLLWLSVFIRLFSYGLTNQILTLFLKEIGASEENIGAFMSLTLAGDVILSFLLTWYAEWLGRRRTVIYGSIMMVLSGIIFAYSENYKVLLFFAIVGVISPSSDEVGPFKSIEESMMAHLTAQHERPEVYGVHAMCGILGGCFGAITCGTILDGLRKLQLVQTDLQGYKVVFMLYTGLAVLKLACMLALSDASEQSQDMAKEVGARVTSDEESEQRPLLASKKQTSALSHSTVVILCKLLVIFMVDSFGSGFMTSSWIVYYYVNVFHMSSLALGFLFFVCRLVMASSAIPSTMLTRKFGPVRATLMTQIPSALFFIIVPFVEPHLGWSVLFLNLYNFTTAMDVTPRQILLTNLVTPKDLTRVMGIVNIGKTFARCIGPTFTGILANNGILWLCFVISGGLVTLSDILLAILFYGIDSEILSVINL